MPHLIIATRNTHKVSEIQAVLGPRFSYHTLRDLPDAPEIAESGDSFEANARLKSAGIASWLRQQPETASRPHHDTLVLADDSGLEVDSLHGAPGVQSARFAAPELGIDGNAPDGANNAKLLRLLAHAPPELRSARFRCVLALTPVTQPAQTRFCSGTCEGRIGFAPRGAHGFGYDPLFIPQGFSETLAELGESTKNRISHRAHALQALLALLSLPTPA
jgi:XTP/dITP diphosphohydrolase